MSGHAYHDDHILIENDPGAVEVYVDYYDTEEGGTQSALIRGRIVPLERGALLEYRVIAVFFDDEGTVQDVHLLVHDVSDIGSAGDLLRGLPLRVWTSHPDALMWSYEEITEAHIAAAEWRAELQARIASLAG